MAIGYEFLIPAAQKVYEEFGIKRVIEDHNKVSSDNAWTFPLPASDIGKVTSPRTGYGAILNVQQMSKRNEVGAKVWRSLSINEARVIEIFREAWAAQDLQVDIGELEYKRFANWSSGSNTILMPMYPYKKAIGKNPPERSDQPKTFVIGFKGLKNDQVDPHELMTASIIKSSTIYNINKINHLDPLKREEEYQKITEDIQRDARQVNGAKDNEIESIKGDFVNLAKAISVSNFVVGLLVNKKKYRIDNVYQTGAMWDSQVKPFQGYDRNALKSQDFIIKAYNSSDLIIEFSKGAQKHYWGISLKKKGIGRQEPDPTLLNKPVVGKGSFKSSTGKGTRDGYLTYKLGAAGDRAKLLRTEVQFWSNVHLAKYGQAPRGGKSIWMKKLDNDLAGEEKNAALTGKLYRGIQYPRNTYFEQIDQSFRQVFSHPNNFREFLDIVFRLDISNYVNRREFHFSLVTGSGDLRPDGTLKINPAKNYNTVLMNEVFNELFAMPGGRAPTEKDFIVEKTRGKVQAFEGSPSAAKLFYTMRIGKGSGTGIPIVNLEVRYKGAITNNPQFQVFITTNFQRLLRYKKSRLQNQYAF